MFNEERKLTWIASLDMKDTTKAMMHTYMNRIAQYEEQLDKDCCEFTREEVLTFYKEYNASSVVSISNMNSKYKVYTEWCIEKGYTKENAYADLTIFDWEQCCSKEKPIISREDLLSLFTGYVGKIVNPCDQFLCLALFEGICGVRMCEFMYLTMNDFKGNEVHLNTGRVLTVSNELIRLAEESTNTYEKIPFGTVRASRPLKDEPYIIKSAANVRTDTDSSRLLHLRNVLSLCKGATNVSAINQLSLIESGRIHMIKELQKEQGHKTWEEAFKANIDAINYRYEPALKKDKITPYARKYWSFLYGE